MFLTTKRFDGVKADIGVGWQMRFDASHSESQSRDVKSVFGELVLPFFASDGGQSLTVTVNNLFDEYPPICNVGGEPVRNQSGFRNGNTVGRLVQVGISTKF
ncbi:MAG: hypothetical protein R3D89_13380 [Sphingomonadaceae bacterium]